VAGKDGQGLGGPDQFLTAVLSGSECVHSWQQADEAAIARGAENKGLSWGDEIGRWAKDRIFRSLAKYHFPWFKEIGLVGRRAVAVRL
jgi:hypothetical protein